MARVTRRTKTALLFACFLCLCLGLAAGMTQAGKDRKGKSTGSACVKDRPCADCGGMNGCSRRCKGGGCAFKHTGMGGSHFYCPDGNCTLDHSGDGEAVLHCPGGGCKAVSTGNGQCKLVECKKGCSIDCKGLGRCVGP
jgi:hypothetical protein